jgi:hypothetical protein
MRALAAILLLTPAFATAQVVKLDRPVSTLSEPFSFVRGVRELSNGRLLVVDWIENRVVIADLTANTVRRLMREGGGPQEVRLPSGLVRLRGDTTLLYDDGNNRSHILGPDGRSVRTILADVPGRGGIRGVDATGAFLYGIPAWSEGPKALPDDSVRVVRWDARVQSDPQVIAVVQGTRYRKDRSPALQPRLPMVGFASQDSWVVAPNGMLVVVRATPYRVELYAPGRAPIVGPSYTVTTRAVTTEDKKRFIREFSNGSAVSGRGPNGGMGRAPQITDAEVTRMAGTAEWAERFPPFDASTVVAGADGRIWVGAPLLPGTSPRYDVFDQTGKRVSQVELRPGRRIVHVGARGLYAVAEDADGVQTIERYRVP